MRIVESIRAVRWPRKHQPGQRAYRYGEHVLRLRG
jgi:hypothetical protein